MPSMVHEVCGDLFVVIHPATPPTEDEWMDYLRSWRPLDMARMRTIVFTDGGGPNAAQRKLANEALAGKPSLTAVVSSSQVVRGMVTALSWFNPKIKAFGPEEALEAFHYLGVRTPEEIARTWSLVERVRARLGDRQVRSVVRKAA
jgi:hypothetical protein